MKYEMRPVDRTDDIADALRIWIDDDPVPRQKLVRSYLDGMRFASTQTRDPVLAASTDLRDMGVLEVGLERMPGLCGKRSVYRLAGAGGIKGAVQKALSMAIRKNRFHQADQDEIIAFGIAHAQNVGMFARLVSKDHNVLLVCCYLFRQGARQIEDVRRHCYITSQQALSALTAAESTGLIHGMARFRRWYFDPGMRLLLAFAWDLMPVKAREKAVRRMRGVDAEIAALMPPSRRAGHR